MMHDANDGDRICGFGYQRELSSSLPIIAQNCDAARDKIKRRPLWPAFDDDKLYGLIIIIIISGIH